MTLYRESVISRNIIEELYREKHLLKNHCREILSKKNFIEKIYREIFHYLDTLSRKFVEKINFYRKLLSRNRRFRKIELPE